MTTVRPRCATFLAVYAVLTTKLVTTQASVDLTHVDSRPVLGGNESKPLAEIATPDDLARSILVGPNGVIDPPTLAESPVGASSFGSRIEGAAAATNWGAPMQSGTAPLENSSVNGKGIFIRIESSDMNVLFGMREGKAGRKPVFVLSDPKRGTTAAEVSASNDSPDLQASSLFLIGVFLVAGWMCT